MIDWMKEHLLSFSVAAAFILHFFIEGWIANVIWFKGIKPLLLAVA